MKPLCYISSPGGFIESNLEFHRMIYHRLLQDGHVTPIAPLLPMMIPDIQGWFPERKWIDYDLEILWHCDVMLMVSATPEALKNSNGCKEELDFCFDNNIHVMTSVRALYKWLERKGEKMTLKEAIAARKKKKRGKEVKSRPRLGTDSAVIWEFLDEQGDTLRRWVVARALKIGITEACAAKALQRWRQYHGK